MQYIVQVLTDDQWYIDDIWYQMIYSIFFYNLLIQWLCENDSIIINDIIQYKYKLLLMCILIYCQ